MAEFFRFRSINALLGEYQELEKQTIYFASPEQLNDPMEGFRDIVWSGDEIVWTNFFKHYVFCLHRNYLLFIKYRDSIKLDSGNIPILEGWNEFPTPLEESLFDDIWHNFLNLPRMREVIVAMGNAKLKIRYNQIACYLRVIHSLLLTEIPKSYIKHGLISKMPQLPEELPVKMLIKGILAWVKLAEKASSEEELDQAFFFSDMIDNNQRLIQQYNSQMICTGILGENNQLVSFDFPKIYIGQLERLLWPEWYTACFMKSYHNSSVWGNYGDNHKGACLIFETVKTGELNNLELNRKTGSGSITIPFYEVRYADRPGEIDFFRTICRLPVAALRKLWYTDQDGNISECAAHIGSDGDESAWRKNYWDNFFRDITIKTKDWAYEQEYRLILSDSLGEFSEANNRELTYNFNSLKGIIFGIKISDEDRLKIIDVVQRKCRENNRTDFKFFQAHYSSENGDIRKSPIQLPFAKHGDR